MEQGVAKIGALMAPAYLQLVGGIFKKYIGGDLFKKPRSHLKHVLAAQTDQVPATTQLLVLV